jgi:gas vesicle protein
MASNGEKVLYFLVGSFVGAAIGMLLAPQSGEQTRQLIGTRYREGSDMVRQKAREGKEIISGTSKEVAHLVTQGIDRGKETIQKQKDQLTAAVEAGKQAYEEEKKRLEESAMPPESGPASTV